jgi:hypothetical protein
MVVFIALDDVLFGGGPCRALPYIVWGGQGYMEILAKYKLWSPTRVLLG